MSKTFAIIKPDAVKSNSQGYIINMILRDFEIKDMRQLTLSGEQVDAFYAEHIGKTFFEPLKAFMTSGPCIVLALEREGAVAHWRKVIGATNPREAEKGTIRALYGDSIDFNAAHGSDSDVSATREIEFFF